MATTALISTPTATDLPAAAVAPTTAPTDIPTNTPKPTMTPTAETLSTPTSTLLPDVTSFPTEVPALPSSTSTPAPTTEALAVSAANVDSDEQAQHGLGVYKQLYCGLCHKLDAAGTAGTFGPPHNGIGTIAAQRILDPLYKGKATTAAEYIHESIVDPKAFIVPDYAQTQHQMPIYNFLSEADVDALVQMLLQQK